MARYAALIDVSISMKSISYITLGLILFLIGMMHVLALFKIWDQRIFLTLNHFLSHKRTVPLFRALWPLGTTPVTLVLLASSLLLGIRSYLSIMLVYLSAVAVERIIKIIIKRPRPFTTIPGVRMLQPRHPADPSFPSGDALRVWFLAIVTTYFLKLPKVWFAFALLLALLISLGRVAMGVHYFLDVIGGAGLGILFAGMSMFFTAMQQIAFTDFHLTF